MGRKLASWFFAAAVMALSVTPALGVLLFGPSAAGANEQQTQAPALLENNTLNPDFLGDAAAWLEDHFYLRQELISLNNALTAGLFGASAAEDVLVGRDGWLYYASTVEDYTGTGGLTARDYAAMAENLALMEEYCRSQGREFVFLIAPNKNSVYPEHMPDLGVEAAETPGRILLRCLAQKNVTYIDLFQAFEQQDAPLYFAHDSHWNSRGAALGADLINEAFGRESEYFTEDFSQRISHDGDLYAMMYPAFTDPETDVVFGDVLDFSYTTDSTRADSITLGTAGGGTGSLLCYRDSFGNLLYPYLADSFAEALFSRATRYDLTQPGEFVLIELVERNLRYLLRYTPDMPAPARDLSLPESSGTAAIDVGRSNLEGMQLLTGQLPETPDETSAIYVAAGGMVYQAFCMEDNGFAAHIPADAAPEGIAFYAGGQLRLLAVQ